MANNKIVKMSGACLYTILRDIIERDDRECIGDLIGKKHRDSYPLINAYPWVSAHSKPGSTGYEVEPRKRVVNFDSMLKALGAEWSVIGHYHSHPYAKDDNRGYMHREDIGLLRNIMQFTGLEESIQIIASVKKTKRKKDEYIEEIFTPYQKKLRVRLQNGNSGYDVIFASYLLNFRNCKEIPIRRRSVKGYVKSRH